jgi:hypothetical protein
MRALVRVHRKRQFPKQLLQRRRARRRHLHAVVSRDILDAQDIVRVAVRARRREHARCLPRRAPPRRPAPPRARSRGGRGRRLRLFAYVDSSAAASSIARRGASPDQAFF